MRQVMVFGHHGELLHPCNAARARQLLRNHRARKVLVQPFTIQLLPALKAVYLKSIDVAED
jgi:hypothetical protein